MVGAGTSLSTLGERLPFHPPATTCLRYPAPTYTSGCAALRRSARLGLEHQAGAVHAEALALGGRAVVEHMAEVGRSEEHTSELQSLMRISYAVFCLKKKKNTTRISLQQTHMSSIQRRS